MILDMKLLNMFIFVWVQYDLNIVLCPCLSVAICDEPGPGGVVVSGDALWSLRVHGFLSVYSLGVCHHCM